ATGSFLFSNSSTISGGSIDKIQFDGTVDVAQNYTAGTIGEVIFSSTAGINTLSNGINVEGNITKTGAGFVIATGDTIFIGGNFSQTAGLFGNNATTLRFDGAGNQTFSHTGGTYDAHTENANTGGIVSLLTNLVMPASRSFSTLAN